MKIDTQSKITLHFSLSVEGSADVIDDNFNAVAPSFVYGDGSLLPAFEHCLLGLQVGDEREFIISPEDAFGEKRADNIHRMSIAEFENIELSEGLMVRFSNPGSNPVTGVVQAVEDGVVTVDFNHPLAGQSIVFRVKIVAVDTAQTILIKQVDKQ